VNRRGLKVDAVFDIETANWDTFVVGGIFDGKGYSEYWYDTEETMATEIVVNRWDIYSHFGGRFDMLWCLDKTTGPRKQASAIGAGNRLISARANRATLRDSWAVAPMSLEKFTGGAKKKLGLDCRCGEECGGFCALSRKMSYADRNRVSEYLEADCKELYNALCELETYCAQNDIDLCATIGGSAWRNIKRTSGIVPSDLTEDEYHYLKPALFGGRIEVYQPCASEGWEHDKHSAYPAMLAYEPMPVGKRTRIYDIASARAHFSSASPGFYSATVDVPEMDYPPLPVREGGRIFYPFGRFQGRWAFPELRRAVEVGCSVEIWDAMIWEESACILTEWCERIYALETGNPNWKTEPEKNVKSRWSGVLKFLRNSMTGKFNTGIDRKRFLINPDRVPENVDDLNGRVFAVETQELSECGHLEWGAYLTAWQRVHQHIMFCHAGDAGMYGDTDSVISSKPLSLNIGNDLGQYSHGKHLFNWDCIAPKVYSYTDADGKLVSKAKGIKLRRNPDGSFRETPQLGFPYPNTGVHSLMPAANKSRGEKLFLRREGKRHLTRRTGGRILMASGRTRAPHVLELDTILNGE
jgi:hypothetical protein